MNTASVIQVQSAKSRFHKKKMFKKISSVHVLSTIHSPSAYKNITFYSNVHLAYCTGCYIMCILYEHSELNTSVKLASTKKTIPRRQVQCSVIIKHMKILCSPPPPLVLLLWAHLSIFRAFVDQSTNYQPKK